MKISVTETGYVVLEMGTCLAEAGNNTLYADINGYNEHVNWRPDCSIGNRFLFPNIGNTSTQINGIQKRILILKTEPFFNNVTRKLSGTTQKTIYTNLPVDDPMREQPDLSLAKKSLNWQPNAGRAEGMQKTFVFFKNMPKEDLYKSDHKDFLNHIKK